MHRLIDRLDLRAASVELVFIPANYIPNGQSGFTFESAFGFMEPTPTHSFSHHYNAAFTECDVHGWMGGWVGGWGIRPDVVGRREERVVVEIVDMALDHCPRHSDGPNVACSISSPRDRKLAVVLRIMLKSTNSHISYFRV
jgi:hypothetical protein